MKKYILSFLLLIAVLSNASAQNKKNVAFYATGWAKNYCDFAIAEAIKKVTNDPTLNCDYIVVNRNGDFIKMVEKEHLYQQSGSVDDSQIAALGKEFGAKFVYVILFRNIFNETQIEVRLIDVEKNTVATSDTQVNTYNNATALADDIKRLVSNSFENVREGL